MCVGSASTIPYQFDLFFYITENAERGILTLLSGNCCERGWREREAGVGEREAGGRERLMGEREAGGTERLV